MIRRVFVIVGVLALLLSGTVAAGNPVGVTVTADRQTVTVGETVTYTGAVAVCDYPPCRLQFVGFGSGFSRLGTPLGEGSTLTYRWAKAGTFTVQFRVTNSRGTNGRESASVATIVQSSAGS